MLVGHIRSSSQYLLTLINEVLDLARIEGGRLDLDLAEVPIATIVDETVSLMIPQASARNIHVIREGRCQRIVRADAARLRQVLTNLLSNAVKYSPEGGCITVACTQGPDGLRIAVTDKGTGIPENKQSLIFQPFERLGAEQSGIEGTGIGLAIAKRLIEAMEGRIGFESRFGSGSTFWVALPLADTLPPIVIEGQTCTGSPDPLPVSEGPVATLLYLMDHPTDLHLIKQVFQQRANMELVVAPAAEFALALVRQHRPDLILMDVRLPAGTATEMLHKIRLDSQTRNIPVFAIGPAVMPDDLETAMQAGFDAYIAKPYNIPELIRRIQDALPRPKRKQTC